MKKIILLMIVGIITLSACSAKESREKTEPETQNSTTEASATASLNESQKLVFDAVIKMTKEDFYEPSKVRLLEIGDYTIGPDIGHGDSPEWIVVRLQGENKVGGTLNHYYRVCIKTGVYETGETKKVSNDGVHWYDAPKTATALFGQGEELSDYYSIGTKLTNNAEWEIGAINRAIKEYWQALGID